MTTTIETRGARQRAQGSGRHAAVVRFHVAPPQVRAAFRILEHTAAGLGARWAERIWFGLPKPREASGGGPPGGTALRVDVGGRAVAGEVWGAGPVIYLVHGWAGRRGDLAAFVSPLVARGYRVVAFDAPSHGESAPGAFGARSSSLPEFVTALSAVVAAHGPAHAVIAHSMGAAAAAAALCDGMRARRLAMLAPMASVSSYALRFATMLGYGTRIHRRLIARVERRIGAPLRHFEVPELGRAVAMPPTLIVHDVDDRSMPVSDGPAIAAAWVGSRLLTTAGLGHRRILRDPGVVAEVVDFVSV